MFALACGITSNLPTVQPTVNPNLQPTVNIITQTSTISQPLIPSPTTQLEWQWKTSNYLHTFWTLSKGGGYTSSNYNNNFDNKKINFFTDEFSQTVQTRILRQQDYYDGKTAYFLDDHKRISALDINSKNLLWQSNMQGEIIGLGLNTILIETNNNRIYGLDKKNGEERWKVIIGTLL
jgi:outer membrane protein assembly factor BamB